MKIGFIRGNLQYFTLRLRVRPPVCGQTMTTQALGWVTLLSRTIKEDGKIGFC